MRFLRAWQVFHEILKRDKKLMDASSKPVERVLGTPTYLSSGATHDSSAMSDICPIAMLFVRCLNGISHSPKELASE